MKIYTGTIANEDAMMHNQQSTFHAGYRVVLLPVDTILWRFVSRQYYRKFSDFWVDAETMATIMQTLHHNGNFSETYKKENIRNSLAILEAWGSNLSWRLKIKLLKATIAYMGDTGTQKNFTEVPNNMFRGPDKILKATETRLGRMRQYVIPRFRQMPDKNEWASVEPLVHI